MEGGTGLINPVREKEKKARREMKPGRYFLSVVKIA